MDDRNIMENLLLTSKGACELYLHGTIESSTSNVRQTFMGALNDCLRIQDQIYKQMEQKGWYTTETVPLQKMEQVRQKYTSSMNH